MENNENQYCQNCGHKISSSDEYCQNCGQKLAEETNSSHDNERSNTYNDETTSTSYTPKKPMKKGTKIKIGILIVLVVVLGAGYLFGSHYYSREATAARLIDGIKSEKASQVADNSFTEDPSYKIDKDNFKGMFKYFKDNKNSLASLQRQFDTEGNHYLTNKLTLEQHGNAWLIFPKYEMNIKPVYTNVSTNVSKPDIKVDGEKTNVNNKKIGPLTPGKYKVDVNGKLDGKKVSGTRELECIDGATPIYMKLDSGVASKSIAKDLLNGVFSYLSVSTVKDGSYKDYFDNESKNDFYQEILGMVKSWDKSKDISSFSVNDVSIKSVKAGPNNTTKVVVDVDYKFYQSNGDEKDQTMEYSVNLVKNTAENSNSTGFVVKDEFAKGKIISQNTDTSGHIDNSDSDSSSSSNNSSDSNTDDSSKSDNSYDSNSDDISDSNSDNSANNNNDSDNN